ncbi:MAG: hypothetical protein K0U47_04115 [Epsilonproteobacteria bacterium]|nr:hypothetical protein [Campylobacterota bacterium]
MYKVVVENECACFIKSKKPYEQEFEKSFLAYMAAEEMVEYMQKNFCKRHDFRVDKSTDGYTYKVKMF